MCNRFFESQIKNLTPPRKYAAGQCTATYQIRLYNNTVLYEKIKKEVYEVYKEEKKQQQRDTQDGASFLWTKRKWFRKYLTAQNVFSFFLQRLWCDFSRGVFG